MDSVPEHVEGSTHTPSSSTFPSGQAHPSIHGSIAQSTEALPLLSHVRGHAVAHSCHSFPPEQMLVAIPEIGESL